MISALIENKDAELVLKAAAGSQTFTALKPRRGLEEMVEMRGW